MNIPARTRFCLSSLLLGAGYACSVTPDQVEELQAARASETGEVSYTNDIRPIVQNFCITCHAGKDPEGEFTLTDYASVRAETELGGLLARIHDKNDPMPESGLMPSRFRDLFQEWADTGYLHVGTRPRGTDIFLLEAKTAMIEPIDIEEQGFDFLERMQGHWVGELWLMGQDMPWFAFDYRAISPSHLHGIFEGGSIGNLFTSFFIARYGGKRVLMARNGGILNGIYRTSYFLLDQVKERENGQADYRFVDAIGGAEIMWIDVSFHDDQIEFASYTSRFGLTGKPSLHMRFQGKRRHEELAREAAAAVGFSRNVVDVDFPEGLPMPNWGEEMVINSASYIWQDPRLDLVGLGRIAKNPIRIDQMPFLSELTVAVTRSELAEGKKLLIYLSKDALTDAQGIFHTAFGYLREDFADGLLLFPEVSSTEEEFTFTYLHPGRYFLTVIVDANGDGFPSPGDITAPSRAILMEPESRQTVQVDGLEVQN